MRNREAGSTSIRIKPFPLLLFPPCWASCQQCSGMGLPPSILFHRCTPTPSPRCRYCCTAGCSRRSPWEYNISLHLWQEDKGRLGAGGAWGRCWSWSLMVRLKTGCGQPSLAWNWLSSLLPLGRRVVAESLSHFPNGVGHFAPKQTPLLCLSRVQEGCRVSVSSCLQPSQGTASLPWVQQGVCVHQRYQRWAHAFTSHRLFACSCPYKGKRTSFEEIIVHHSAPFVIPNIHQGNCFTELAYPAQTLPHLCVYLGNALSRLKNYKDNL